MKKFDFAVQSSTFAAAIVLLVVSAFENDILAYIALAQLFLGAWQLLSYLTSLFTISHATQSIKDKYLNYTVAVVGYFLVMYINSFIDIDENIKLFYLFGPPWVIALYYCHICYLKLQIQKSRHSFLDLN